MWKPKNAWSKDQERQLQVMADQGIKAPLIAKIMNRTLKAIYSKLSAIDQKTIRSENCKINQTTPRKLVGREAQKVKDTVARLQAEIPDDTRTPVQIMMGEPGPNRSALGKPYKEVSW